MKPKRRNKRKIILATHLNPDLDACMAIWLLKKFAFAGEECILRFVPMHGELPPMEIAEVDEVIYIDTSGGKYDHHNIADENICAASLVMKDLSLENDIAIKRMVEYTLRVDHGKIFSTDVSAFDLINTIEGLNKVHRHNPELVVHIIESCLDGIYASLRQIIEAEKKLENVIVFKTKWGEGAGVMSSNPKVRYLAHRRGFKVFIYVDSVKSFRGYTAPGDSDVDFTDLFKKLKDIEPEADWFLHSSKKLLLCGSGKAPDRRLSSLSLEQMVNLIKE
jgi:hypothetical protein